MKLTTSIRAVLVAVPFIATALTGQKVKTDYDRSANFGLYKTYSWEKIQTTDPLWNDRIQSGVDAELSSKGWAKTAYGGDVSVIAIEMTQQQQTLNTFYDNFGGGWGWRRWGGGGFGTSTTTTDVYKVGSLVVDVFDAKTKKLMWRGSANDTLSDKADTNIKKLHKALQKMFQHFPPDTPTTRSTASIELTLPGNRLAMHSLA